MYKQGKRVKTWSELSAKDNLQVNVLWNFINKNFGMCYRHIKLLHYFAIIFQKNQKTWKYVQRKLVIYTPVGK